MKRKTRIIGTLGPSSSDPEVLDRLIAARSPPPSTCWKAELVLVVTWW